MVDRRLLVAYAGGFIGPLAGNTILALVGSLKDAFQTTVDQVFLSIPVYMIPFVIFQLFSGTISDTLGRRIVVASGFLVYSLGSLLCGLAGDIGSFLGGRFVQGLGFAFVTPVLHAVIGDFSRDATRGVSMGIYGAVTSASVSTGPLLAGFLDIIDWRLTFYLISALALIVFFAIEITFGKTTRAARPSREGRKPVRDVLSNVCVLSLCTVGFITFLSYIGVVSYTSDALSESPFFYDPATIGIVLFSGGIGGVLISPFAGYLVDKMGRFRTGIAGFAFSSLAMLIFIFSETFWQFILAMVILGCAASAIWASLLTLTVEIVPQRRGTVASLFNSSRFAGYALSPVLFAGVYFAAGVAPIYLAGIFLAAAGIAMLLAMKALRARRC